MLILLENFNLEQIHFLPVLTVRGFDLHRFTINSNLPGKATWYRAFISITIGKTFSFLENRRFRKVVDQELSWALSAV